MSAPLSGLERVGLHRYGDNIDTDSILAGRYLTMRTSAELGAHCMENIDPDFVARVRKGDVMIGGKNFGSGSSREHAPLAIQAAGISCVVAISFARIFYRNAINIGLPVFECAELVQAVRAEDRLAVDLKRGRFDLNGQSFQAIALAPYVQSIVDAGGLVPFISAKLST